MRMTHSTGKIAVHMASPAIPPIVVVVNFGSVGTVKVNERDNLTGDDNR